jgi:cytochrome c556
MRHVTGGMLLALALALDGHAQPAGVRSMPRLEPVAETRLLMEGLAQPNFRGMERHLQERPSDTEAWVFMRGQALLLAETANLLMLRPPRSSQAQAVWFDRALELRRLATDLARVLARRDLAASRSAFVEVANSCNRCHQSFRVPVEVVPFATKTTASAGR